MEKYEEKDGVWRTIRGRRVFIAKGESLSSAMAKSGKFKRNDIRETREAKQLVDKKTKFLSENNPKKAQKYKNKLDRYDENAIKNRGTHQAFKNQIMQHNEVNENGKTRVERNEPKYSYRDKQELRHEELQKKLAEYKAKKQSNNKFSQKEQLKKEIAREVVKAEQNGNYAHAEAGKRELERLNKQSNNKYFSSYEKALKESGHKIGDERSISKEDLNKITNRTKDLIKEKEQSNNKQEERRLIKQGNKYIVARGNDTDKEAIKKYNEDTRRPVLMKFAQDNKEQIKKWVNEYDEETDKRAFEKIKRGEGLTAKEYFGFLGQGPKAGEDVVGYSEKAKLASDGNVVKASRFEAYEKNPKANRDAILTDDDMYKTEDERRAEEYMKNNTIKNYVEKKKSNNAQTTNRILERSGKVNQKTLKSYAKDGLATDISNYSDKELDKLEKKHGKIRAIKTTSGVYGMNGGLFRGEKSGEYFVITSRSGNLYRLV